MSRRPPSLRRGLMLRMLLPTAALALVLGLGGALVIRDVVETTHDRLLDGSVLAIAERLALDEDNEVTVDLPRVALGMLESQAHDRIYYSVSYQDQLVTGYRDLPRPASEMEPGPTRHWDAVMRGAPVRVAAQARRVYGKPGLVLVQVAETRDARRTLEARLFGGLFVLEAVLLALVGVLTWHGISRGLAPLDHLSAEIDRRAAPGAISLQPLDASRVPAEAAAPVLAFNTLLARLEQVMVAVRRFTADASHQMRTPLAVLRMHVDLARRHGVGASPEGRAALDDIEGAALRLEHLLAQLLALARADEDPGALVMTNLDLAEVAATVLADQVPRALAAGVEIEYERPSEAVMVPGHATLVGEILANIVDNAIRYAGAGARVVVRVANEPGGAIAEVEDDGPGIAPQHREKVFSRFYRVARSGGPEGSGLGLAVVRALADRIGAAVTLGDARRGGSGLLVRIVFPPVPMKSTETGSKQPDP
ncbi:integral membrane sensor signal transduction histidine kinase [Methylobacterium sp. 4-46]|uniref:sensor histidine kinase n=1 Tax=unclassified Methylobacterium TaxID=2615210 RepID=UPI000165CDA4|nr:MULTISPECIES: sensor histidine kinase [Methylobacterium]ACA20414.1 integral membrane sensor signal transduction histidine kinase [Methylobacterium sp. 4-46]WFT79586.1 sensor histidine kinase [Methylobacterium nodulans]